MSRREDVKRVLEGKTPDYVPWFGDLDYWLNYLRDEGLIPEEYLRDGGRKEIRTAGGLSEEGLQKLHRDLKVGFYLQAYFPFREVYHQGKVETEETPFKRVTRMETPYGTLREEWRYIPETYSFAPVEHLIKDAGDLKAFRYVYEHMEYQPEEALAKKRLETVGENGIVLAYTPKTPMMELVALKAGLETVVIELLGEAPEELEELLCCMEQKHTKAAQIAIDSPAEYIFVPDNLSSEMVGGSIYDTYIKAVHEDWTARIKKAGKKSMVHLDGTLHPLLGKLARAGFDVIEAITPAPVGDISLEELRSHVLKDTVLWGGIPSGFFSEDFPQEKFEAWIRKALEVMKKDRRFVMGVADQIVPKTSMERVRKVAELVEKYGKMEK